MAKKKKSLTEALHDRQPTPPRAKRLGWKAKLSDEDYDELIVTVFDFGTPKLPGFATYRQLYTALVEMEALGASPPTYTTFMHWVEDLRRERLGVDDG